MSFTKYNDCRIVQIAWHIYSNTGDLLESACYFIKPTFTIPAKAIEIHGITQEMAESQGIHMVKLLGILKDKLPHISHIVAHNLEFDKKVLLSEMARYDAMELFQQFENKRGVCTMLQNTLPGQRWPKLADLYKRLFHKDPEGRLHHADTDVQLCADIYFHNRTIIS